MHRTILEIRYQLRTRNFWIAVLLSVVAFMEPAVAERNGDILYLYNMSICYGIFLVAAPFIAVIPGVRILSNYQGHIMRYNVTRSGRRTYICSQAVVVAVTGGIALALGPLISVLLLALRFPLASEAYKSVYILDPLYNASFSTLLNQQHYVLFLMIKLCMVFGYGFSVNMIAFVISTIIQDSFVITFSPFILLQGTSLWTNRLPIFYRHAVYLHGNVINLSFNNTWGFIGVTTIVHISIAVVSMLVGIKMLTRRWANA